MSIYDTRLGYQPPAIPRPVVLWVYEVLQTLKLQGYPLEVIGDFIPMTFTNYLSGERSSIRGVFHLELAKAERPTMKYLSPFSSRRSTMKALPVLKLQVWVTDYHGVMLNFINPDEDLEDLLVGMGWRYNTDFGVIQGPMAYNPDIQREGL